jgi:hypothetical protein
VTFTWDATTISTDLARVRDAIGDTDSNDPILTDERINALLALYTDWRVAAVHAIDRMIAHYARNASSRSAIGLSSSHEMIQNLRDLKTELSRVAYASVAPILAGSSEAEKEDLTDDTDAVQPVFNRTQFDNNE